MPDWIATDQDRELFDRELNSYVPEKIFDSHAHWYRADHFPSDSIPGLVKSGPPVAGSDEFDRQMEMITPGRKTEGLFFPFPHFNSLVPYCYTNFSFRHFTLCFITYLPFCITFF